MLAVAFAYDDTLTPAAPARRVLDELDALAIPVAVLVRDEDERARATAPPLAWNGAVVSAPHDAAGAPGPEAVAALAAHFGLPPECIRYLTGRGRGDAQAASAAGAHGHYLERIDDALEVLREPYTRSALNLRYIMRTVLEW